MFLKFSMEKKTEDSGFEVSKEKMILKSKADPSIAPIVEKAMEKGWSSISVRGNIELCRATWFEAKMAGLQVKGYKPTWEDENLLNKMEEHKQKVKGGKLTLLGSDAAQDYNSRVIPFLQKKYEELRKLRSKLGVTTTDTDRAYGINAPRGYAREVDEKFDRIKGAFLRALDDRDFFLSAARQRIPVEFSYEDGIARFVIKAEDKAKVVRERKNLDLSRRQS